MVLNRLVLLLSSSSHSPLLLGVAPRAKVNQQRARRFRTAKEAQVEAEKARKKQKKGAASEPQTLEFSERFDSNCITPGTEFMVRLGEQLRALIARRVGEDLAWRNVQIIFSGPEVPGEGEHKIMEFIRLTKAKADYDANVRHCLYGLDADLILLGLLSHDPHFALLREEVTFGGGARANQAKKSAADTRFYLLHLCLMREYMELEFAPLFRDTDKVLSLEELIDDFILLMCFVGNDFLPNLPGFHLGEGVLETLFAAYKKALSRMNRSHGFLNSNGRIHFGHVALVLKELIPFEVSALLTAEPMAFDETRREQGERLVRFRQELAQTFLKRDTLSRWSRPLSQMTAKERSCASHTAQLFGLYLGTQDGLLSLGKPAEFTAKPTESLMAEFEAETERMRQRCDEDHVHGEWKRTYYLDKLGFDVHVPQGQTALRDMMKEYCQGLQWNMLYYYEGVASWSWFYPYHYAPHISDLAEFMGGFVSGPFELALPLKPLEQLMAVLPPASAKLVPLPLAALMTAADSPVRAFYPTDFVTDANGKKASWEAIVKIPFIDEALLLPAIVAKYPQLRAEELARNQFGATYTFEYAAQGVKETIYELPVLRPDERFVAALCRGARVGLHAMPGFPTLATLPVQGVLDSGVGLEIFGQPAKGLTMVLQVAAGGVFGGELVEEGTGVARSASSLVGRRVFVHWPHLREAVVDRITDGCHTYALDAATGKVMMREADGIDAHNFETITETIQREYQKRCAVAIGVTPAVVWVRLFVGMRMSSDGAISKEFSSHSLPCAMQMLVLRRVDATGKETADERYEEQAAHDMDLSALFPLNAPVVYVGGEDYGAVGRVLAHSPDSQPTLKVTLASAFAGRHEPIFPFRMATSRLREVEATFVSFGEVQRRVGLSGLLLAKLTSTLCLFIKGEMVRASNLGLDLKSEKRKTAAWGLARRGNTGWLFAPLVLALLEEMKRTFPAVIAALELVKGAADIDAAAVFPGVETRDQLLECVAPIQDLIRSRLGRVVHVSIEGDYLPREIIQQLAEAWHDYERKHKPPTARDLLLSAQSLLSPLTGTLRLRSQQRHLRFSLGHRVAYVGQGSVPFGIRGIVVGIDPGPAASLRLMLDQSIIGGGDLDGMVPEGCGVVVERGACLNLNVPLDWHLKPSKPATKEASARTVATVQGRAMKPEDLINAVARVQLTTTLKASRSPPAPHGRSIPSRPVEGSAPRTRSEEAPSERTLFPAPPLSHGRPVDVVQAASRGVCEIRRGAPRRHLLRPDLTKTDSTSNSSNT